MLTESGLKRKAIGEYPMHAEKNDHRLASKEHIKHQEKREAKCFPLLSLIPSPGVHEMGCPVPSGEHLPSYSQYLYLAPRVIYKFP